MDMIVSAKRKAKQYAMCSWLSVVTLSLGLSGCATPPEDLAMISQVVTALPQEIEGCSFVGEVDNDHVRYTIQGARDNLRLQTAKLGANTVVETHLLVTPDVTILYPHSWFSSAPLSTASSPTFYLSGRAYICGEGQGPKRQLQGTQRLFKDTPQPLATAPNQQPLGSGSQQPVSAEPAQPASAKPALSPAPAPASAVTGQGAGSESE